jgi:chromosomal replication initiation ATPase DnaA
MTLFILPISDVLIIDDVQFLSGKSGTQDVFFHILTTYIKMVNK